MGRGFAGHNERRSTAPRAVDVMVERERLGSLASGAFAEIVPVAGADALVDEALAAEGYTEELQIPEQQ